MGGAAGKSGLAEETQDVHGDPAHHVQQSPGPACSPMGVLEQAVKEVFDVSPAGTTLFHSNHASAAQSPLRNFPFLTNVPKGKRSNPASRAQAKRHLHAVHCGSDPFDEPAATASGATQTVDAADASSRILAEAGDRNCVREEKCHTGFFQAHSLGGPNAGDPQLQQENVPPRAHSHADASTVEIGAAPIAAQSSRGYQQAHAQKHLNGKGVKPQIVRGPYRKLSTHARRELESIFQAGTMKPGSETVKALAERLDGETDQLWQWFRNRRTRRRRNEDQTRHSKRRRTSLQPPVRSSTVKVSFDFDTSTMESGSDALKLHWFKRSEADQNELELLTITISAQSAPYAFSLPGDMKSFSVVLNPHTRTFCISFASQPMHLDMIRALI